MSSLGSGNQAAAHLSHIARRSIAVVLVFVTAVLVVTGFAGGARADGFSELSRYGDFSDLTTDNGVSISAFSDFGTLSTAGLKPARDFNREGVRHWSKCINIGVGPGVKIRDVNGRPLPIRIGGVVGQARERGLQRYNKHSKCDVGRIRVQRTEELGYYKNETDKRNGIKSKLLYLWGMYQDATGGPNFGQSASVAKHEVPDFSNSDRDTKDDYQAFINCGDRCAGRSTTGPTTTIKMKPIPMPSKDTRMYHLDHTGSVVWNSMASYSTQAQPQPESDGLWHAPLMWNWVNAGGGLVRARLAQGQEFHVANVKPLIYTTYTKRRSCFTARSAGLPIYTEPAEPGRPGPKADEISVGKPWTRAKVAKRNADGTYKVVSLIGETRLNKCLVTPQGPNMPANKGESISGWVEVAYGYVNNEHHKVFGWAITRHRMVGKDWVPHYEGTLPWDTKPLGIAMAKTPGQEVFSNEEFLDQTNEAEDDAFDDAEEEEFEIPPGGWGVLDWGGENWLTGHGVNSNSMMIGDVNGDHKQDAVVGFSTTGLAGNWYTSWSHGAGFVDGYGLSTTGLGAGSDRQFLDDVNGDGKADAIAYFKSGAQAGNWRVALSNGGGFGAPLLWASNVGANAANVNVGDVNGDGLADLVAYASDGNWNVALSHGTSFDAPNSWTVTPFQAGSNNQLLGDVNGDGMDDAVAFRADGSWYVAISEGDKFVDQGPTPWMTGHGVGSSRQLVADVNGDHAEDSIVMFSHTGDWFSALSNRKGFGPYYNPTPWASGIGRAFSANNLIIGDVSGDNTPDAVAAGSTNGSWNVGVAEDLYPPDTKIGAGPGDAPASTIISTSSATFDFSSPDDPTATSFECSMDEGPFQACGRPKTFTGLTDATHVLRVRARDAALNIDPTPDVRSFTVDTVKPDTKLSGPQNPAVVTGVADLKAVGDVNGDQLEDAAYLASDNHLKIALSDGVTLGKDNGFDVIAPEGLVAVLLEDVDGDGLDDAVFNCGVGDLYVARSTGAAFAEPTSIGADLVTENTMTLVGDVSGPENGERKADVVSFDLNNGAVDVAVSTGEAFSPPANWIQTQAANPEFATLADTDNDQRDDLVYVVGGDWYVAKSTGTGFTTPTLWRADFGRAATSHTLADVTGDGRLDALAYFAEDAKWFVAKSTGTAFTGAAGEDELWSSGVGVRARFKALGDFDGDQRADIFNFFTSNHGEIQIARSTGESFDAVTASSFGESRAFNVSSEDPTARFECRIDGASNQFVDCPTLFTADSFSEGIHTVEARSIDEIGNVDPTPAKKTVTVQRSIAVNFQPAGAPGFPSFLVDGGAAFGPSGNGYTYGWKNGSASATVATVDRDSSSAQDQRYDTFALIPTTNPQWEISVPNGSYRVRVVAGDANAFDSVYRIAAESMPLVNGIPTTSRRWVDATAVVTVEDGALTLSSGTGAVNNKISFVEIARETDSAAPETTILTGVVNDSTILSNAAQTFTFESDASDSSFECRLDSGVWASCDSPYTTPTLANGRHTVSVKATDASGNTDPTPAKRAFVVAPVPGWHINFQPSTTPRYAGYKIDSGDWFGDRGNGLVYGWSTSGTSVPATRERNAANSPDKRYDTTVQMGGSSLQATDLSWSMQVPNGIYRVRVVMGDPNYFDSIFKLDVQGKRIIDASQSSNSRWKEGTVDVQVNTGRLRLTQPAGASNNKINFIDITALPADTVAPTFTVSDPTKNGQLGQTTATFDVATDEPAMLSCRLDGATATACGVDQLTNWCTDTIGPDHFWVNSVQLPAMCRVRKTYNDLAPGTHSFEVIATDLHGNSASASRIFTVAPAEIRVNFQPAIAPTFPGYLVDSGGVYGLKSAAGISYGWRSNAATIESTPVPIDRDHAGSIDQRYDTFVDAGGTDDLQTDLYWVIGAPNGTYDVRVVAGDPNNLNAVYKLDIEGQRIVDGVPTSANPWVEGVRRVTVNDGSIAMTQPTGSRNNKPNFITITPVADTVAPVVSIRSPEPGTDLGTGTVGVSFFADEPSTFQCKLDSGSYEPCGSPKAFNAVPAGEHVVTVSATDSAGNIGMATTSFSVRSVETPIRFNFQPAAAATVPGYVADSGGAFKTKKSGLTFGWLSLFGYDPAPIAYDRDATNSPDQKHDTFLTLGSDLIWSVRVENGNYRVRLVAGDPSSYAGHYKFDVQSTTAIDGAPTSANRWLEGTVEVEVTNGTITVVQGYGAQSNKLAFLEITPIAADSVAPSVDVTYPSENQALPQGAIPVEFSSPDPNAAMTCELDGGTAVPCGADSLSQYCRNSTNPLSGNYWITLWLEDFCTPTKVYDNLAEGPHTIVIRATDDAGNVGTATRTFTVIPATMMQPIHINFQPANSAIHPGYLADTGSLFGDQNLPNGSTYGWNAETGAAVDRNSTISPDQRYDTFVEMGGADGLQRDLSWSIEVPTGNYRVHVVAGDPETTNADYKLDVQGVSVVDGSPTASNPWVEGTRRVRVDDGALAISQPPGSRNNRISHIEITPVSPDPVVTIYSPSQDQTVGLHSVVPSFYANTPASFQCQIDDSPAEPCKSKQKLDGIDPGQHTLTVTATNANGDSGSTTRAFSVSESPTIGITFQPSSADAVDGYLVDSGGVFWDRGNGHRYGWNTWFGPSLVPVQRELMADKRYASFIPLLTTQNFVATWEIALPYGEYEVRAVAGDAVGNAGQQFLSGESRPLLEGSSGNEEASKFVQSTSRIPVTDGALTITGSATTKLNFLEITQVGDSIAPTIVVAGVQDGQVLNQQSATFRVTTNEAATVRCGIDAQPLVECGTQSSQLVGYQSTKRFGNLSPGDHTWYVSATDAAGNSASSAVSFKVGGPWTRVQFMPSSATPAEGYSADNGEPFGTRESGANYGWMMTSGSQPSVKRNPAGATDSRYFSNVTATTAAGANARWAIALPYGTYRVHLVGGDPVDSFGIYKIKAENKMLLDGATSASNPWIEGTETVTVVDGVLNIGGLTGSVNAKFDFIEITPVEDDVAPTVEFSYPANGSTIEQSMFQAVFTADEPGSFRCKLDHQAYSPCSAATWLAWLGSMNVMYTGVGTGAHTIMVEGTDAAGNTSVTKTEFTVNMPQLHFNFGPAGSVGYPEYQPDSGIPYGDRGNDLSHGWSSYDGSTNAPAFERNSPKSLDQRYDTGVAMGAADGKSQALQWDVALPSGLYRVHVVAGDPSVGTGGAHYDLTAEGMSVVKGDPSDGAPWVEGNVVVDVLDGKLTIAQGHSGFNNRIAFVDIAPVESDRVPPETFASTPSAVTADTTPEVTMSTDEQGATFQCKVDDALFADCTSPYTTPALADGAHVVKVRALDSAGNADETPARVQLMVDTQAPTLALLSPTADLSSNATPTLSFNATDANGIVSATCSIDGGTAFVCESGTELPQLADGSHDLVVTATDGSGASTSVARTLTVDATSPDTSITAGLANASFTSSASPTFSFTSTEVGSFECKIDDGLFAPCTSGSPIAAQSDATHTFDVRAVDGAGNTDATPASRSFTTDTVAPTAPSGVSFTSLTQTSAMINWNASTDANGIAVYNIYRNGAFVLESGVTSASLTGLTCGTSYTINVVANDPAANWAASANAALTTAACATAPVVAISSPLEEAVQNGSSASIAFSATNTPTSITCKLDSGTATSCTSPKDYSALAQGPHTVTVAATNAGGTGTAVVNFTVDNVAPVVTVATPAASATTGSSITTAFSATDAISSITGYTCKMDAAAAAACTTGQAYSSLGAGSHTLIVTATDQSGNVGSLTRTFTVGTAPVVTISAPASGLTTSSSSVSVTFAATNSPTSTTCQLDSAAASACTSPKSYTSLTPGSHTVTIAATNASGTGAAAVTFTVDTTAPDTTITSGPANASTITANTATYGFSSNESGTFECKVDAGTYAVCTTPFTTPTLTNATHTVYVRAKDAAGNYDGSPASRTVTVNSSGYWLYQGTVNMSNAAVALPSYGTYDWVHWGRNVVADVNRKSPITSPGFGGTYSLLGTGGTVTRITAPSTSMSWTSGTPTATVTSTYGGLSIGGATNRGFRVTIPVTSANNRMVYVVFGALNTQAKITASISDGSITTVSDTPITNTSTTTSTVGAAGFHVRSASPNATISFDIQQNTASATGSVQLYAATVANE